MTSEECCGICGEEHSRKYVHTLKCNHSYHYECILKTFTFDRKRTNACPLCRQPNGFLPLVNGLPRLYKYIHYVGDHPTNYECTPCNIVLQSGKRKGNECGKKCMIGLSMCKRHHISALTKKDKILAKGSTNTLT
jgi:hypothetical protein